MKIISINAGSSSLKFSLYNMDNEQVIASGVFERIGIEGGKYTIKYGGEKVSQEVELDTHTNAVNILLEKLVSLNIISSLDNALIASSKYLALNEIVSFSPSYE